MDIEACVLDLKGYIAMRGQREGQRWLADGDEIQAILEKHIGKPAPAKKKAGKKDDDVDAE